MKLTVEDLKEIIETAIKEFSEAGEKGRDGYQQDEDCPIQPRGFSKTEAGDFSLPSLGGNRLKRQGSANFGPYTSESAIRAIAKDVIREATKPMPAKKSTASAPYNDSLTKIGEAGSVGNVKMPDWKSTKKSKKESSDSWFDVGDMKKNRSKTKKNLESNILQGVYEARVRERKRKK